MRGTVARKMPDLVKVLVDVLSNQVPMVLAITEHLEDVAPSVDSVNVDCVQDGFVRGVDTMNHADDNEQQ